MRVSGTPGATPLVLLHGGGQDKSTWDGVAPAFASTHHVYAPDLRGFGQSPRGGPYSFEAMRDDVLDLLDAIGAERIDLIGHSMGGTVAWLVAEEQPDRIGHLVIEDTTPPKPGSFRSSPPERPAGELPFDWDALMAVMAQLNDPDPRWWDRIGTVAAPTLLLAGGPSSHVPQHLLGEALALLPLGKLVEIPVGHHIHREAPQEFLAHVVPFLATP